MTVGADPRNDDDHRPPSYRAGMKVPPSWDEEYMTEWSLWSLLHGLPALPADVVRGESVPVARWVGPRYGAVMHVQWQWRLDADDAEEDDYIANEIELFMRRNGIWESSDG